jgi:membrane fusion protein (multidrug efflux system)
MFVHERLAEGQRSDALLAPQQGVSRGPTGDATAMVVGDGDKIEVRNLKTGRAIGTQWLVTEGLKDGDRVVVEGLQKIKANSVVRPEEFKAPTPGGGPAAKVAETAPPKPAS